MFTKSLKAKIAVIMSGILIAACAGLGAVSYYTAADALKKNTREMLAKLADEASMTFEARISSQLNTLEDIASSEVLASLKNGDADMTEVEKMLDRETKRKGHKRMAFVDRTGKATYNDGKQADLKEREYFKKAMEGQPAVSDPVISLADKSVVMVYAVPVKAGKDITGVLIATRDGYELSALSEGMAVGNTGNTFIVNSMGQTIAHTDRQLLDKLMQPEENQTDATTSATLNETNTQAGEGFSNYEAVREKMKQGEKGFGEYSYKGVDMYVGFAPIGSLGWSIAIQATENEIMSRLSELKKSFFVVSLLFLVAAVAVVYFFSMTLTKHITRLKEYALLLEKYDLSRGIPRELAKQKDELGELARAFSAFAEKIREIVSGVKSSASKTAESAGRIAEAADVTGKSAEQIAVASGEVALGTSRQAEFVETVMNLINRNKDEVGKGFDVVSRAMDNAQASTKIAESGKTSIFTSIEQLAEVSRAVETSAVSLQNLEKRSVEIGNIVGVITGIASQTNLLALNASIEAARAGEAGKGFAVVAEEIRKLAEDSAEAARSIRGLIRDIQEETSATVGTMENSLGSFNLQVEQIKLGGQSLETIFDMVTRTENEVMRIHTAFKTILGLSDDIVEAIVEISGIIEETAAHSQEVAATTEEQTASAQDMASRAEELLYLATRLKEEIDVFKTE